MGGEAKTKFASVTFPKRQLSCSRTAVSFIVQIPLQRKPRKLNGKAGLETGQVSITGRPGPQSWLSPTRPGFS